MSEHICGHSGIQFKTKDTAEQVSSSMVVTLINAHNKLEDQLTELREELDDQRALYASDAETCRMLLKEIVQAKKEIDGLAAKNATIIGDIANLNNRMAELEFRMDRYALPHVANAKFDDKPEIKEEVCSKNNMTFAEAYKLHLEGKKVRRPIEHWRNADYYLGKVNCAECDCDIDYDDAIANDWYVIE